MTKWWAYTSHNGRWGYVPLVYFKAHTTSRPHASALHKHHDSTSMCP